MFIMDDNALDRLFSGDLNKLVDLPKRLVRLFISSTFTDMTLERNSLMERVYPRLKKYCREKHGLDFQVVDMRWGVRDEATDDHQTTNLCSREIDNCQRMSLGPNFVALLGDKYGFRPLCNRIKSTEYRALRRCLIELDINTDFLDTWYKEDLNAVPAEYLLQPISSILKNFTNRNEPDLQAVDQQIWQAIQERLHELLMIGSSRLVEQNRMSREEQLIKYSISVTEREVIEGCLDVADAKSQCLVYIRRVENLSQHLEKCLSSLAFNSSQRLDSTSSNGCGINSPSSERKDSIARKASLKIGEDSISLVTSSAQNSAERKIEKTRKLLGKYVDLISKENVWKVDEEAQQALSKLKNVKLENKLKANGKNLIKYDISWHEQDGISLKSDEHKHYLNDLTEHFLSHMTRMIRKASKNQHEFKSGLVGEILQHSHYAKHVSKTFYGRDEELEKVKSYITSSLFEDSSIDLPMFIYGVGGSGKTSLLARAAILARDWYTNAKSSKLGGDAEILNAWNHKACIIMRFCCTTPNSSSMVGVLTSVCRQLQYNFYQFGPLNVTLNETNSFLGMRQIEQLKFQPIPEDFVRLVFTFRQLLDNCQHEFHRNRLFLIVLDSVERLSSPAESSVELKYSWLTSIAKLPRNVKLIVSCSSEKTSESWGQDYKHLKRHFLLAYLDAHNNQRDLKKAKSDGLNKVRHNLIPLEDSERTGDILNGESSDELMRDRAENHYMNLKRVLIPAVKFMRALNEDERVNRLVDNFLIQNNWSLSSKKRKVAQLLPLNDVDANLNPDFELENTDTWNVWIVHVRPLGVKLALKVARNWLAEIGRNLSQQQWSIVEKSFAHCSRPIFVKLAFGEIVNWKSYSMQNDSKGLTFGSSKLVEQGSIEATGDEELDAGLAMLRANAADVQTTDAFNGQILSTEQEWLNYLDYRQREQDSKNLETAGAGKSKAEASVVIRVGDLMPGNSRSAANVASVCHLSNTIDEAICQLFARIELQHGYILTKHSLSYITAARNGICENELEDILSLDDVVLDDVFQYHLPPVRRIPPLLWTRIRNDLPDYLSERDADGIVVNWHHSQFKQATLKRYLCEPQQVFYIHSMLADYFLGKWADKAKPFRCTKQQSQMAADQLESAIQQSIRDSQAFANASGSNTSPARASVSIGARLGGSSFGRAAGSSFSARSRLRSSDQHDHRLQWMQAKADRRVPHQPLYYNYTTESNRVNVAQTKLVEQSSEQQQEAEQEGVSKRSYNMRKLTELPHHLIRSGRFLDLFNHVLFNYKWLYAALDALGFQSLLSDMNEASESIERELVESSQQKDLKSDRQKQQRVFMEQQDGISLADELDGESLKSMLSQLRVLSNTIRLSCSSIHADTQMLAPQLIGRLLPLVRQEEASDDLANKTDLQLRLRQSNNCKFLKQLLEQCDKDASSHCALLPMDHCLQSPDGLLLSSLEGHSFAIMSMCIAADGRHLLAISNRFIMWDISTGEVSRDIDPKIEGSTMRELKMGSNNCYAIAFTSDNILLVLDILTQQITKFTQLISSTIIGLNLVDKIGATKFIVWSERSWFVLRLLKNELSGQESITIELLHSFNIAQIFANCDNFEGHISNVQQVHQQEDESEMTFVEIVRGDRILFVTLKSFDEGKRFQLWPEKIEAASLALESESMKQLVYCGFDGNVYLRRRRKNCWSKAKVLANTSSSSNEQANSIVEQLNLMAETEEQKIETKTPSIAMRIELDSYRSQLESHGSQHLDNQKLSLLGSFERKLDCLLEGDEIEENCVYEAMNYNDSNGTNLEASPRKACAQTNDKGIKCIRLYMSNKIIVLRFGLSDHDRKCNRIKCLIFPKNIRNISVEANKCQIKSIILGNDQFDYIVVAVGRRLLMYDLNKEQFLKCIEAHNSRIVQLIPIIQQSDYCYQKEKRDGTTTNSGAQQLTIASASMDKTVKIWDLANVHKDTHLLDKLDGCIEFMSVCSQRPLVACLARGELGIWDWRTLRLIGKLSSRDIGSSKQEPAQCERETESGSTGLDKIVKCCFNSNGRYLYLASTSSLCLLALEGPRNSSAGEKRRGGGGGDKNDKLAFKMSFKHQLPCAGLVRKLVFFLQDSRVLAMLECNPARSHSVSGSYSGSASDLNNNHSTSDQTWPQTANALPDSQTLNRLSLRPLLLLCHSIPDGRLLYTIECFTPTLKVNDASQYLQASSGGGRRRSSAASNYHVDQLEKQTIRLPVMTRDQLHIVSVGSSSLGDSSVDEEDRASTKRLRRKSSAVARIPTTLLVYSTRDGQLARTIDLNQLETGTQTQTQTRTNQQQQRRHNDATAAQQMHIKLELDGANSRSPRPKAQKLVSINGDQFSRLKSISYRERRSVVALIDEDKGTSYLVDVNTKQLLACSSLWNGKISSDGRYGLSRMFKYSAGLKGSQTAASAERLTAGDGLQLLEMRHISPVKSLLSNETRAKLAPSEAQATGSDTDVTCGFTKPNDAYVYYHDSRLSRLLLIRLRDNSLVANYKLSVGVSKIKCCAEGFGLILGQKDGSLTSLAVVDPLKSDTLLRLSQYPSRASASRA